MTRAFAAPRHRALAAVAELLDRAAAELVVSAERLWVRGAPAREWGLKRLVQAVILTCVVLAVIRRTDLYERVRQRRLAAARGLRDAWARAEGFEMEAAAGIALVVLAGVILLHGFVSG